MADGSKEKPPPPNAPPQRRPPPPNATPPPNAPPQRRPPPPGKTRRRPPQVPKRGEAPPKKKRPAPPRRKAKPKKPPKAKKGRRIKIKLGLKTKAVSEELDTYTDQVGWTTFDKTSKSPSKSLSFEDIEVVTKKGPETVTHQCTMCGARMEIPAPKRDRYKVICAHPDCGHVDMIGLA